jgi:acetyl-CoA acetyltransferase
MIHVRHAAAAIASGLCETVLITHGESGRAGVGRTRNVVAPTSLAGQFEQPYGPMGPPTLFTIPVLRYMKTYGLTTSNWQWSRSSSANGRPRTRAPPSRRRSRSRMC